jgi:leucyl aminopeptidase
VEFSIRSGAPDSAQTGCLVVGVYKGAAGAAHELTRAAQLTDRAARGALQRVLSQGDLSGRIGSTLMLRAVDGVTAERVLLVGLGEKDKFGEAAYRDAVRGATNVLKDIGAKHALLGLCEIKVGRRAPAWNVRHAVLAVRDALYRFDQLKSAKTPPPPALAHIALFAGAQPAGAQAQNALKEALATADGVDLARTLGNLPSNHCTPTHLAEVAQKIAKDYKLGIEVLERKDMERLGMGSLLSVTSGSRAAPKFIVLRHNGGAKKAKPIVLVGKGITFDTGGISLKPAPEMDEMKYDMSGAGSVLGAIRALAGMKARVNVIGVVPACENMPGGLATKPGDIVTALDGQTIEILNTDAEGRLILCDALAYAKRFDPEAVVDIATLTGACVIALGHVASGLFANDQKLADRILDAADDAWDRVWQMPLFDEYQEQLRSNFADMANIGGRPAGSVTAACFLSRFAKKLRWAHLDIAGTAWKGGRDKGSTGRPVPLLVRFALQYADAKGARA